MSEQQYRDLLLDLHDTLQGSDNSEIPIEVEDENLNAAAVNQGRRQDEEYDSRNRLYTELMENYIKIYTNKEKHKTRYKIAFFVVTMVLFFGIVVCGLIGIVKLSIFGDGSWANVGIAISNIAGIISTIVILPKIIAEHLFPVNEESNMIEMVKNMQENDANIRNILYDMDKNE